jgi:hypothetical protein
MTIDEFIEIVYPKLKMKTVTSHEFYTGKELKLTGHKKVNGGDINDNMVYKIPTAAVVHVNHKRKLRLAWLRGGKAAVRTYLSDLIPEGDLNKVMTVL